MTKAIREAAVECNTADTPEVKIKSKSSPVVTPKAAVDSLDREFDWSDPDTEILPEQPAYYNQDGSLVIRQQQCPDEDAVIVIAGGCIDVFIDKLTDIIGIPSFGGPEK